MKKIITFFINLQEIIKDKYFLSCVDDEKLEELLEDIELKDKNNSEELIKRLGEFKEIKIWKSRSNRLFYFRYIFKWMAQKI